MKVFRCILLMVIALTFSCVANAQELKVVSFEKLLTDVTARSTAVKDGNGDVCALIKVSLPVADCEFAGNIVGKPKFHVSEYWVYMTPSSKKLIVRCPGCESLNADFGIAVESAVTYNLRLSGYVYASNTTSTSSNIINGHEYVDLGLPSGIKWATCNIGASSPSENGDYFAWGEIKTKATYKMRNSKTWTKSFDDISGNPQYDIACANWGDSWRLPSEVEFRELKDKCIWKWTTQESHNGYKVTGPNGNSIFLPAAGWRVGSSLSLAGDNGFYWSSTPSESSTSTAYSLDFSEFIQHMVGFLRFGGCSVRPVSENTTINGHEYVDLGLPSGVKWATCNVGASSPSEYGDYFAWGETAKKVKYTKENCKTWEKNIGDISGNPDYDAARANWGGSWRLPSKMEIEELKEKCIWTWTKQNGYNGYKITGSNGKSIFLPAAGWYLGASLDDAKKYGGYWSSTPDESYAEFACGFSFDSSDQLVGRNYRGLGCPVRPVTE